MVSVPGQTGTAHATRLARRAGTGTVSIHFWLAGAWIIQRHEFLRFVHLDISDLYEVSSSYRNRWNHFTIHSKYWIRNT